MRINPSMRVRMSVDSFCTSDASVRISVAMIERPLPASPARAPSIDTLNDSIMVCRAIPFTPSGAVSTPTVSSPIFDLCSETQPGVSHLTLRKLIEQFATALHLRFDHRDNLGDLLVRSDCRRKLSKAVIWTSTPVRFFRMDAAVVSLSSVTESICWFRMSV